MRMADKVIYCMSIKYSCIKTVLSGSNLIFINTFKSFVKENRSFVNTGRKFINVFKSF